MRPDTQLDFAVFQLTPNQDRCELHVVAHGQSYRLASGLLKPFLAHLSALEEQISQGGQSIRLEPPNPSSAVWFTKGTVERFVRYVSTPEVLELVSTIEMELLEVAEAIRAQANNAPELTPTGEDDISKTMASPIPFGGNSAASDNLGRTTKVQESMEDTKDSLEENTVRCSLRALDAHWMILQKEQEMAFARALAAGFVVKHVDDLVLFAENFGAYRLREACIRFMAFCKRRQESGMWIENIDQVTGPPSQVQGLPYEYTMHHIRPKEYPDAWSDIQGGDAKLMELRRASFPIEMPLPVGENGIEMRRQGSFDGELRQCSMKGVYNADYNNSLAWSMSRQDTIYGRNHLGSSQEMHSAGLLEGSGEYTDMGIGRIHGLGRGQSFLPSWQGQPQSQYIQGNPVYRSVPPALPSAFGVPMLAQGGLGYPQALENPYVHQTYNESKQWQTHAPLVAPSQFWLANQGDNKAQQIMNVQKMEGTLYTSAVASSQHQRRMEGDNKSPQSLIDEHTMGTTLHISAPETSENTLKNQGENKSPQSIVNDPMGEIISNQLKAVSSGEAVPALKEVHEQPISMSIPAELINTTRLPSNNELSNEIVGEILVTKEELPEDSQNLLQMRDDHLYKKSGDENPTVRRLPRRASSPSRRSVSPMRKVHVALSGSGTGYRRSRSFSKRGISNAHDVHNIVDNTTESSESENDDDNHAEAEARVMQEEVEHVRVRVQDVIGLFERKKEDSNDVKKLPISRRLSSKNSVLSRWSEDGVHSEAHSLLPGDYDALITVKKNILEEVTGSKFAEDTNGIDKLGEHDEKLEKQTAESEITPGGHSLEQPDDDAIITFQPCVSGEMQSHSKDVLSVLDGDDTSSPVACENHKTDILKDHIKDTDDPHNVENGVNEHINGESRDNSNKKMSDKEAKAKAMQEMLEKRKASLGGKLIKPTPLAMAQSRAEKLRAYKAGLQQSKKEKEEEERKRIEGLKTQRRERIASRTTPVNGTALDTTTTTITTPTKRTPRNPSLRTVSPKISNASTSPRLCPANGSANSLSPISKASRSSRYTSSKSARELNVLSQSVPSLSDISKENLKSPTLSSAASVRASTGSQRFSPLQKKTLKDADANNQEEIIKKRPMTVSAVTAVRKGIFPAAKDSTPKGEISSASQQKSMKVNSPTSISSKHSKRPVKSSGKGVVLENDKITVDCEYANVVNDKFVDSLVSADKSNVDATKEEINAKTAEVDDVLNTVVYDADSVQEQENNYAQPRAPPLLNESAVPISPSPVTEMSDLNSNVKESVVLATSDEVINNSAQDLKDSLYVPESSFNNEFVAGFSYTNTDETEDSESAKILGTEDSHAPVAHVSSVEDNNTVTETEKSEDYEKDKALVVTDIPAKELVPSRQDGLFNESPVITSSKSLPRLLEAIQQAHSPEAYPMQSNKSRKKWGDSGSQKSSKDHQQAKGLKRLLFLGRKSHRGGSAHNSIEVDEGIDELRDMITSHNNGKNRNDSIFVSSFGNQVTSSSSGIKDNVTGSSSVKGSRSFFSLSALRGKGESKA